MEPIARARSTQGVQFSSHGLIRDPSLNRYQEHCLVYATLSPLICRGTAHNMTRGRCGNTPVALGDSKT